MARKGAILPMGLFFIFIILSSIVMANQLVRHELEVQRDYHRFLTYKAQAVEAIRQMRRDTQQTPYQTSDGQMTIYEKGKHYICKLKKPPFNIPVPKVDQQLASSAKTD